MSFAALAPLWNVVGPPLRPSEEDIATFRRGASGRTLVLGATEELLALDPTSFGIDICEAMVERGRGRVSLGDWRELPLEASSVDAVLGDGSLSSIGSEEIRRSVLREVRRVLRPDASFVVRTYTRLDEHETREPAAIGTNVSALKVWLWGQVANNDGVVLLDDVWRAFRELSDARRSVFSREQLASVECYAGSKDSYWIPTMERMMSFFEENGFIGELVRGRTYPLAERCPIAILRGIA